MVSRPNTSQQQAHGSSHSHNRRNLPPSAMIASGTCFQALFGIWIFEAHSSGSKVKAAAMRMSSNGWFETTLARSRSASIERGSTE